MQRVLTSLSMKYLLLFILITLPVRGITLDLESSIQQVLSQHPRLKTAQTTIDIAKKERQIDRWLPDPMAKIEYEQIPQSNVSLDQADMITYKLSQALPPTLISQSKKGAAAVRAQNYNFEASMRELTYKTTQIYLTILATQEELKTRRDIAGAYKQLLTSLEAEYKTNVSHAPSSQIEKGMGEKSVLGDVLMFKMKKLENETQIEDLIHKNKSAISKLNLMMGLDAEAKQAPLKLVPVKKLSFNLNTLTEKLIKQNSNLRELRALVDQAKEGKKIAALSLIPTLEPEVTFNQRRNNVDAYSFSVGLNLPIWLNKETSLIKKGKLEHLKSQSELREKELSLKEDLAYLFNHANQHYKIVNKYKNEIVPIARSAFKVTEANFKTGNTNSLDMIQKLISYLEASLMYWDLWQDYQSEYALLESLVGEKLE